MNDKMNTQDNTTGRENGTGKYRGSYIRMVTFYDGVELELALR